MIRRDEVTTGELVGIIAIYLFVCAIIVSLGVGAIGAVFWLFKIMFM